MKFIIAVVVIVGLAIALFVTNPSRADVDAEIQSQMLVQIDAYEAADTEDPAIKLIVQACKISRNACSSFLASFINVKYDDKALYSEITLTMGNKEPVTCYGLLTRVICPDL